MRKLTAFAVMLMGIAAGIPLTAGGSSSAHLYPVSPSQAIQRSFNENYAGKEGTYPSANFPGQTTYGGSYQQGNTTTYYSVTVGYTPLDKPYVIKKSAFMNNPNYYYGPMSGTDTETWFVFETGSSSHSFPERYLHQYFYPTATKDTSTSETISGGRIRITYTLADGKTTVTKDIPVNFEKRECEAYSNGRWQENAWEGGKAAGWVSK